MEDNKKPKRLVVPTPRYGVYPFTQSRFAPKKNFSPYLVKGNQSQIERVHVIEYLQRIEIDGMRKHLCFSCSFVTLYDKNNKPYKISRTQTLESVKAIVEEIRKVNLPELK